MPTLAGTSMSIEATYLNVRIRVDDESVRIVVNERAARKDGRNAAHDIMQLSPIS